MDATDAERINDLARSLYNNRLVASMDEAFKMAENILGKSTGGESRSVKEMTKENPGIENVTVIPKKESPSEISTKETTEAPMDRTDTPKTTPKETAEHGEHQKLANLRRIVSEEEERIAKLKEELEALKASVNCADKNGAEVQGQADELEADLERANQEIAAIHTHIHDLEELKRGLKEVQESEKEYEETLSEGEEIRQDLEGVDKDYS